jgi:hypothetical protein
VLLSKWILKHLTEEGIWQELIHNKYIKDKTLLQVKEKPTNSPFWKELMRVKDDFFTRGFLKIGNGEMVHFWDNVWLGKSSLANQYPSLNNIVQRKNVLVANVLSHNPLNIEFRRVLNGDKWIDWLLLCQTLMKVNLSKQPDKFVWKCTKFAVFTIKSMYLDLMNEDAQFLHKYLRKLKLPLKIKIFM